VHDHNLLFKPLARRRVMRRKGLARAFCQPSFASSYHSPQSLIYAKVRILTRTSVKNIKSEGRQGTVPEQPVSMTNVFLSTVVDYRPWIVFTN
jgi:hypothetical protein